MLSSSAAATAVWQARLQQRRTAVLTTVALVFVLGPAKLSRAQIVFTTYNWNNPGGGDYNSSSNWTPSGVPNSSTERARFDLAATYAAAMPESAVSVQSLSVPQGNVTLNFPTGPFADPILTYTASIGASIGSSAPGSLTIAGGALSTGTGTLGVDAGSEGRLTIDRRSDWTSGATVIGAAGSGRLELLAGAFSGPLGTSAAQSGATTAATVLGQSSGANGRADVAGIWQTGDFVVGDAGTGEVNLMATGEGPSTQSLGQLQSSAASIAAQPGSTGIVNVAGSIAVGTPIPTLLGTQWNIAGSLAIGGSVGAAGGSGRLAVGTHNGVTVGSNLRIWPGGSLAIQASSSGIFSSSSAGEVAVSGAANLNGALEFTHGSPGNLQIGDEIEILTATGGVTGTFSTTSLTPLGIGRAWAVTYNPTSVVLRVVPGSSFAAADFDEDGDVDRNDLTNLWIPAFGVNNQADADADGDSDGADFLIWQRQLSSESSNNPAVIPEPSAAALTLIALMIASLAKRHDCAASY